MPLERHGADNSLRSQREEKRKQEIKGEQDRAPEIESETERHPEQASETCLNLNIRACAVLCSSSHTLCFLNKFPHLQYGITYWKKTVTFKKEMPKSCKISETLDLIIFRWMRASD